MDTDGLDYLISSMRGLYLESFNYLNVITKTI